MKIRKEQQKVRLLLAAEPACSIHEIPGVDKALAENKLLACQVHLLYQGKEVLGLNFQDCNCTKKFAYSKYN